MGVSINNVSVAELKACFRWACVVELDANTDAEMHLNGLSCNDME